MRSSCRVPMNPLRLTSERPKQCVSYILLTKNKVALYSGLCSTPFKLFYLNVILIMMLQVSVFSEVVSPKYSFHLQTHAQLRAASSMAPLQRFCIERGWNSQLRGFLDSSLRAIACVSVRAARIDTLFSEYGTEEPAVGDQHSNAASGNIPSKQREDLWDQRAV
jgi:hypothetical protein